MIFYIDKEECNEQVCTLYNHPKSKKNEFCPESIQKFQYHPDKSVDYKKKLIRKVQLC